MSVSLRPYVPADLRRCLDIFRSSIEELAADDYDDEQREAWAAGAADEAAFAARLAGALTLIAVIDGAVAGFASLKDGEVIDMLYVDPEFAGQGAGRTLIDASTKLAGARARSASRRRRVRAQNLCSNASASPPRNAISCALATSGSRTPR